MRRAEDPEADSTSGIGPERDPGATWRVRSATALPGSRVRVTFVDGTTGEVHLRAFLESARVQGTVFETLREPSVFAQLRVVAGAVTWPTGADLAPDAMYDAIRATGTWVVEV